VEDKENAPLLEELHGKLINEARTREYETEWARYVACHVLPDVQSEAAVNTFITEWGEAPKRGLDETMGECDRTAALLQQLAEAHVLALHKPHITPDALWHPAALAQLGSLSTAKLDQLTADVLANADERATSRNELQLAAQTPSLKFALWVNLARNPRVKSVEFSEVGLSIELPKALALASVAIRVQQLRREHAAPSFGQPSLFQTLGGVTVVDLLTLPPVPKRVKGWTLRQVSGSGQSVSRMAYPIPTAGGESGAGASVGNAAPLRLTLSLPRDVVVADKMVRVGWWDEEAKTWSLEGVSEIRYDSDARSLSFLTVHLCGLAVLQLTHAELPYKKWALTPTGQSRSVRARRERCAVRGAARSASACVHRPAAGASSRASGNQGPASARSQAARRAPACRLAQALASDPPGSPAATRSRSRARSSCPSRSPLRRCSRCRQCATWWSSTRTRTAACSSSPSCQSCSTCSACACRRPCCSASCARRGSTSRPTTATPRRSTPT
jgi:hypothetical protein